MRSTHKAKRLLLLCVMLLPLAAQATRIDTLSHIHGVAFAPSDNTRLLLATHHGLYRAESHGRAARISASRDDYMALVADLTTPGRLYASGHPATGGNLGLVKSVDAGKQWQPWSDGFEGPVDFHQLAISPVNPDVMYGVHRTLQVSNDGGRSWRPVGPPPDKMISLAVSSVDPKRLYAATEHGLKVSLDGGFEWQYAAMFKDPASTVFATADGTAYAFVLGRGLLMAEEPSFGWKVLYNGFGNHYPLQIAVAHDDPDRLAVLTHTGRLFTSQDAGRSWQRFGVPEPDATAARGGRIYAEYCTGCHGVDGVGETPGTKTAPTDPKQLAPALDGTAHAWHHDDAQLQQTILEGGIARGGRMPAWNTLLKPDDALDLVAYIKTLWGAREHACQGAKHMNCDWSPEG